MLFQDVIGQAEVKERLVSSARKGRVPHAQLFTGPKGSGKLAMALAYAQYLSCTQKGEHDSCGTCPSCKKYQRLEHPDLHFSFPITTTPKVKKDPISSKFLEEWRAFLTEKPYGTLFEWLEYLGVENKQAIINKDEALHILVRLQLKPYESEFKVMIIWMAERMNVPTANKLLKIIEEPPPKTVFLLVTDDEESLLGTIRSRTQSIGLHRISDAELISALRRDGFNDQEANSVLTMADGNYPKARSLLRSSGDHEVHAQAFVEFIRKSYVAHRKPGDLVALTEELSKMGRERIRQFIQFTSGVLRDALMVNYDLKRLKRIELNRPEFQLENFAQFIHGGNIANIMEELNRADYHIERNGNPKIVLLDLGILMNRYLHQK